MSDLPEADIAEIRRLLENYCWANDAGDVDEVVRCFVPDGHYDAFGDVFVGHEQIRDLFARRVAARSDQPVVNGQHWLGPTRFAIDGDGVLATSYFMRVVQSRADGTPSIQSNGWYDDMLVRYQREWRIAKRLVTHGIPTPGSLGA